MVILFLHNGSRYALQARDILIAQGYNCICIGEKVKEFPLYNIGISFLYQYKIPASELTHKWYNFHPGPLPEYGGRNLCYHAIMNEEKEFGATLHYMDEEFDTGPIIDVLKFPINGMTAGEISDQACRFLLLIFVKTLSRIVDGSLSAIQLPLEKYYKAEKLNEYIDITKHQEKQIRALTTDRFCAKILINGEIYEVRKR